MFKLMIVEDDTSISMHLESSLRERGYEVKALDYAQRMDVLRECDLFKPDLIVMDIQLDHRDGFTWCHEIRKNSLVPIVFVTARNSDIDLITAMRLGGDDYITKPFNIEVLYAKISTLLRRTYQYSNSESNATTTVENVIEAGGIELNLGRQLLSYKNNDAKLTRNEFLVMYNLMKNQGNYIPRKQLIRALWKEEAYINENALSVTISRIRSKLKSVGLDDFISTKVGNGYGVLCD